MFKNQRVIGVIVAAGQGKRLGSSLPKQFLKIRGKTILEMSVEAFRQSELVDEIRIAANGDYYDLTRQICERFSKVERIVVGGAERQDSVHAALDSEIEDDAIVLVHDAARPFVSQEVITRVTESASTFGAAVPAVPVKDTIRQMEETGGCGEDFPGGEGTGSKSHALRRELLAAVQTPQGFRADILREALEKAKEDGFFGTDDASLVERLGINIRMVRGEDANRKITTKEDLEAEMRIGTGYDVHRLVEDRELFLCGVKIPHEKGLLGHSDADVALHALMDAMLGAAGLGDIGKHFPDTDEKYRGISSLVLLEHVAELLKEEGYFLGNADITIIAQKPKIAGYIPQMKAGIAKVLGCEETKINIKGTTTEKLGFVGREEGIASEAVCILYRY